MVEYGDVKNPRWLDERKTMIQCDVDFPHLDGVHSFVASATDSEEHGRRIFVELTAGKYGDIAPYHAPAPASPAVADTITDVQFFGRLAKGNRITEAEALAAVQTGTLPAKMADAIKGMAADDQFDARMYFGGSTVLSRLNPAVGRVLNLAFDMDEAAVLSLFAAA